MREKRPPYDELRELLRITETRAVETTNRAMVAERSAKEAREQFDDLKRRLLESETELARLRGYLARVREDDAVREGYMEIDGPQGKITAPKRPDKSWERRPEPSLFDQQMNSHFTGDRREKKHWISY